MRKRFAPGVTLVLAAVLAATTTASAGPISGTYTTGGATVGTGPWTLTSTDTTFSILRFVLDTPMPFNQISDLSVDYVAVLGGIGGGSPRIAVVYDSNFDTVADGSFLIHFGPAGSFADPTLGAGNTGNLLALTDVGRYDLSGSLGGSAYTDRTAALAAAGTFNVLRFSLILDSFGGNDREFVINGISAADIAAVPEPSTLALLAGGVAGLVVVRRRRRSV